MTLNISFPRQFVFANRRANPRAKRVAISVAVPLVTTVRTTTSNRLEEVTTSFPNETNL
jgi:hypothetical protein